MICWELSSHKIPYEGKIPREAGGRLEGGWREAGARLEGGWREAGGRLEVGRRGWKEAKGSSRDVGGKFE
jgi:hypothetical protein